MTLPNPYKWFVLPAGRAVVLAGFVGLLGATLGGCGDPRTAVAATHQPQTARGSFDIGGPEQYQTNRVYTQYAKSHGVYLVSGHRMLVALAAECTNDEHRPSLVRWQPQVGVFRCPTCGAKFTRDGLNRGTSQASRAMERCRIRHSGKIYDRDTTLIVDPGKRFRQEDQEWSKHTSFFPLEDVVRGRDKQRKIDAENRRLLEQPPLRRHR
ncbi:MAG: hypothetical protein AAGG38_14145 [Planctomycetota bacterium]